MIFVENRFKVKKNKKTGTQLIYINKPFLSSHFFLNFFPTMTGAGSSMACPTTTSNTRESTLNIFYVYVNNSQ